MFSTLFSSSSHGKQAAEEKPFLDPFPEHIGSSNSNKESLISLFSKSVRDNPKGIALVTEDGMQMTYEVLNRHAVSIAKKITARTGSDGKAHLVGIMMDRDVGFIAAILGTLTAGATYVPVDPAFPPDRYATWHVILLTLTNASPILATTDDPDKATS